jgi:adenylylsulfate kinase-like enzyme
MLDGLCGWATEHDPTTSVLWLYGPAGAGKSAIAQSLCQRLEEDGHLGGSFSLNADTRLAETP